MEKLSFFSLSSLLQFIHSLSFQVACLLRVPMELIKQRAQVNRHLSLFTIIRTTFNNEVRLSLSSFAGLSLSSGFLRSLSRIFRDHFARNSLFDDSISSVGIVQSLFFLSSIEKKETIDVLSRDRGKRNNNRLFFLGKELFVDRSPEPLPRLSPHHSVRLSRSLKEFPHSLLLR